jgi:hypothetical protein
MDLRSAFLEDSARLLAMSSSSTTAHLMSERIQMLIPDGKLLLRKLRQSTCLACGARRNFEESPTVLDARLDEWTQSLTGKSASKSTICPRCHRITVVRTTRISEPLQTSNSAKSATRKIPDSSSHLSHKSASVGKSNSKQRAKFRKEKTGLQALLSNHQQKTTSVTSLSLLDLMAARGS